MPLATCSDEGLLDWDFCLIFARLKATMSQNMPFLKPLNPSLRWLMPNTWHRRMGTDPSGLHCCPRYLTTELTIPRCSVSSGIGDHLTVGGCVLGPGPRM
jgi:hypothetical protein